MTFTPPPKKKGPVSISKTGNPNGTRLTQSSSKLHFRSIIPITNPHQQRIFGFAYLNPWSFDHIKARIFNVLAIAVSKSFGDPMFNLTARHHLIFRMILSLNYLSPPKEAYATLRYKYPTHELYSSWCHYVLIIAKYRPNASMKQTNSSRGVSHS